MNKTATFTLVTAMALGAASTVYAANPFRDVPTGHWAYGSIGKLAATGIIEGYGDDAFRGERLMTRYEMAQIVAKALAKGANVDKLAAEFAGELDALGVRVAALEKRSDNVKVTAEVRYHFAKYGNYAKKERGEREHGIRTHLYIYGKINDNWDYVGRIRNQQMTGNNVGEETPNFDIAKIQGRLGGVQVTVGRDDDVFADGNIYDGEHDALKLSYGDKWYVSGAYGKLTDWNEPDEEGGPVTTMTKRFWAAEIGSNMEDSVVNGKAGYLQAKLGEDGKTDYNGNDKLGIWYVGLKFNVAKDLAFNAMYLKSDRDTIVGNRKIDDDGFVAGLAYRGAELAKPGAWGLSAKYYSQGVSTYIIHTIDGYTDYDSGFKGWSVGGEVTVAKNMLLNVTYYDTRALKSAVDGDNTKARVVWSEFDFVF